MRPVLVVLVAAGLVGAGCGDGTAPGPETVRPLPEPPEFPASDSRSPDQMAIEILSRLAPLNEYLFSHPADYPIKPQLREFLKAGIATAKTTYGQSKSGKEALRKVLYDLEDRLKPLRNENRAHVAFVLIECIEILNPESSKINRYREWAVQQKNRPYVKIKSWLEPLDGPYEVIYVSFRVYLPETDTVEKHRVRKGEEFCGLRFVEIIGKKSGVLLEYIETSERFEVRSK